MIRLSSSLLAAALLIGCGSSSTPAPEADARTKAAVDVAKTEMAAATDAAPAAEKAAPAEATQPSADGWINYGEAISDAPAVAASAVIGAPDTYLGKTIKVEGEVAAVCKSMGCWLTFEHEGEEITINMKDHGFSVDKQGAGSWCEAEGEVVKQGELYSLTAKAVRMKKGAEAAPAEAPAKDETKPAASEG
ncbi:MAG: DUF4920 domain-containing protein [Deltaproteobacteria bacterium]|nr:DUF4920 domain-containing protein [Deltaproteobacteria bacterium]